jgi:hypothetical protein
MDKKSSQGKKVPGTLDLKKKKSQGKKDKAKQVLFSPPPPAK